MGREMGCWEDGMKEYDYYFSGSDEFSRSMNLV